MGARYPCIHRSLCRAYMRKHGVIYDIDCPYCEFYETDPPYATAAAIALQPTIKDKAYYSGYFNGKRAAEIEKAFSLAV